MRNWLFLLLCLTPCCNLQAQVSDNDPISLVESKTQTWKGFTNAKIVGDSIVFDIEARPVFSSISSQILLTLASGYEVAEIVAESLPALEYVDLIETQLDGKTELSFPPDTKPGQYRIAVKASKKGVSRQAIKRLNVTIGKPEPGPGPEPGPTPTPDDAPIKEPGFRVLITYESQIGYPSWLSDRDFTDYLTANCVAGPKGQKEWRMLDKDAVVAPNAGVWGGAMDKMRTQPVPAILISTGKIGTIQKLPATKAEAIALIKKYAEAK